MLSAKFVRIHGMKDEKWTTKDKLQQFRGILKLHVRDKKLKTANSIKLKKKVFRDLKGLCKDVKEYRGAINDCLTGDKRYLSPLFLKHKDLLATLTNLPPSEIFAVVDQDSFQKRKQLDKLFFKKKLKMKTFFDLKLEFTILSGKIEQGEVDPSDRVQQCLITRYQRSMARHNAAQSIKTTYELMLNILKKDAIYFDAVLESLRKDQEEQCNVILNVTVMGQLVTENLDDNRQKYKNLSREVWVNMKEREQTLKIAHAQVEDIWAFAQSLVRVQSDADITEKIKETPRIDGELETQIQSLEEVFVKVKESLRVRLFEEMQLRLEEQTAKKTRLFQQFELALKERDSYMKKKQHAELILATLEHSMVSTTGQYKLNKKKMQEDEEMQKKHLKDYKETRKVRGKLLMNIKAALQNMSDMLVMIDEEDVEKETNEKEVSYENESAKDKKLIVELPKVETDALALLSKVSRKIALLFSMSNFTLDKEKEDKARDLYQTYVSDYISNMTYGQEEPEPSGILVEHDMIDPKIMTRKDVKKKSRLIVEAHVKDE